MSYKLRDEIVYRGHRLFQPMLDLQTLTSALHVGFEIFVQGPAHIPTWRPGDYMQTVSKPFPDRAVKLSSRFPMMMMARGKEIDGLQITVCETESMPTPIHFDASVHRPFDGAMRRTVTLTFVTFYEQWRPHIESQFGQDINHWPPLFAFARRLRDFLVHNDGVVGFKSQNAASVRWHNVSYGPADNGRDLWTNDLAAADVIVLMFEMHDEMSALGISAA